MIDYFISTHDQLVVDDSNHHQLLNIQYLLLGNKNYTNNFKKYHICRTLKHNMENYPYLCSYTGWYAVIKNRLYSSNYICLLEYDTSVYDNFNDFNLETIKQNNKQNFIIAYSKTLFNHYVFYKSTPWLEIALDKIYSIDLNKFIKLYSEKYPFWPTTTNIAISIETLRAFIEWFEPMTQLFKHHPLGAYVHERALFIFCVLNNIDIIYAPDNLLKHHQSQSHKIQDIYGQVLSMYKKSFLTRDMIPTYDQLYETKRLECLDQL